ncbi:hypothetical protein [Beduini massiliensis]|uniref:hypothetical protein n=1 Tax=Beduini massiliensis TaxID=1585974 RepID=UPI00059A912C|nr:hypothetical protein [Beduini massiliensis]
MIKEDDIKIGNKFVREINGFKFEIIDIKNDNGTEYVVVKDEKNNKHDISLSRFKNLLITKVRD